MASTHRVLLNFILYKGAWHVAFLEADCQTSLPRKFTFKSEDKIREMFKRASALRQLEDEQAMEHGIATGRGGFWLELNEEQYKAIKTRRPLALEHARIEPDSAHFPKSRESKC
jgi:hypothetical protein